ncbi:MAG: EsaB/YukD family protein [Lachnospirales bacterium]
MDNIYIDVYMPSLNKSYDIMLAQDITVKAAAQYILKTISEYEMLEPSNGNVVLCSRNCKRILDGNLTLYENGVRDSGKLIIV